MTSYSAEFPLRPFARPFATGSPSASISAHDSPRYRDSATRDAFVVRQAFDNTHNWQSLFEIASASGLEITRSIPPFVDAVVTSFVN